VNVHIRCTATNDYRVEQLEAIIRTDCTSSTMPLFIAVDDPLEPVPLLADPLADPTPPDPLAVDPLEPVDPDEPLLEPVEPVEPLLAPVDPVEPLVAPPDDPVAPDEPDRVLPDIDPEPRRPVISTCCPTWLCRSLVFPASV